MDTENALFWRRIFKERCAVSLLLNLKKKNTNTYSLNSAHFQNVNAIGKNSPLTMCSQFTN